MCLIIFAYKVHPKYPLIITANRDEFYERPTAKAHWWESKPNLLAGKDLKGGGTWLGVSKSGRFAALTNYRSLEHIKPNAPTRGSLVADFLVDENAPSAMEYVETIENDEAFNGYNLLLYEKNTLVWHSNVSRESRELEAGIYGVSNALLDTPWAKVERGKFFLKELLSEDSVDFDIEKAFNFLQDTVRPNDDKLPDTGVGIELERLLGTLFIQSQKYGTRCSTVVLVDEKDTVFFEERVFGKEKQRTKVTVIS
ncbi:MAG: NRDE family protein [Chitinophagales bacterium]